MIVVIHPAFQKIQNPMGGCLAVSPGLSQEEEREEEETGVQEQDRPSGRAGKEVHAVHGVLHGT